MIGDKIQQKRKELGWTQAQLAERMGVSAPAVNRWEKNLSYPDADLLAPLARCLKTDLNELFSFYDQLSDKERDLLVHNALLRSINEDAGAPEVLEYMQNALRENPSDGKLYKDFAKNLFILNTIHNDPLYLTQSAVYFERALELLPEETEYISHYLVEIYGYLQQWDNAEEAFSRLKSARYDKDWTRAEMLATMKNYEKAIPKIKEVLVRNLYDLFSRLSYFGEVLKESGDTELSSLAEEKATAMKELFSLWYYDLYTDSPKGLLDEIDNISLTTCPLFADVTFTTEEGVEPSLAERISDFLETLKSASYREKLKTISERKQHEKRHGG